MRPPVLDLHLAPTLAGGPVHLSAPAPRPRRAKPAPPHTLRHTHNSTPHKRCDLPAQSAARCTHRPALPRTHHPKVVRVWVCFFLRHATPAHVRTSQVRRRARAKSEDPPRARPPPNLRARAQPHAPQNKPAVPQNNLVCVLRPAEQPEIVPRPTEQRNIVLRPRTPATVRRPEPTPPGGMHNASPSAAAPSRRRQHRPRALSAFEWSGANFLTPRPQTTAALQCRSAWVYSACTHAVTLPWRRTTRLHV